MDKKDRLQVLLDKKINKKMRILLSKRGFKQGDISKYIENLIKKDLKIK